MREGYSRGSCVYQNKERNRAAYPLRVYAGQERKRAMERLTHPRSSGIKTGYWSPNKKDELIERLAAYEDTGLTPKEIERLKEQHRWIPVEERLPEARKDVLVCVKTGWILVAWYGSGGKGGIYRHQMWAHFMKILLPGCRCRRRIRRRRNDEKMLWNLQMEQP